MIKIRIKLLLFFLAISQFAISQTIDLYGKVKSKLNVENIHVINKTAQKFTITNTLGEFKISAKLNDTLIFTSIQHKQVSFLVDENMILNKVVLVELEEFINSLDEIVIGKVLSGNMLLDIGNTEGEPMTSKKAGIPSYQGKPKTQSERRLHEAGEFKPKMLLGLLMGSVPINPILNGISGRTKKLKYRVKLETEEELMFKIKVRLSEMFFENNPLDENLRMDFFYYCSEDENFLLRCKNKNDIDVLLFLSFKYKQYIINMKSKKN